jgi:hypothetical protein
MNLIRGTPGTLGGLMVAFVLLAPHEALGAGVELLVEGSCPTEEALEGALGRHGIAVSPRAGWRLSLAAGRVQIRSPRGELSLQREIPSQDCQALAEAVALIVQTHFARLGVPLGRPPARPTASLPATAARPPASAPPVGRGPEPRAGASSVRRAPPPAGREISVATALSGGLSVAAEPQLLAAAGQLDVALRISWLSLRLALSAESPTEQHGGQDHVRRRGFTLRAGAGAVLARGRWFVTPVLETGLGISRVTALDLDDQPAATRLHPLVGAELGGGVVLFGRWSLRAQIGGHYLPRADRYLIPPQGTVARSPRAVFYAGLGLQVEILL